jgi:formylglycine-generating enzyme
VRILLATALFVSGCSFTLGTDDLDRCTNGVQDGDESDVDCGGELCVACRPGAACTTPGDCLGEQKCDPTAGRCGCPEDMVELTTPEGPFCIDKYEVKVGEYYELLDARDRPGVADLPPACSFNTSFDPDIDQRATPELPIVEIDWCDALAYCLFVGKRLCAAIGGGPVPFGAFADPGRSEWQRACQGDGANAFPYGPAYDRARCNGEDGIDRVEPGALPSCRATIAEIYDLSGNVAEWEDACDENDECRVRGGSFGSVEEELKCRAQAVMDRRDESPTIGFRCCI